MPRRRRLLLPLAGTVAALGLATLATLCLFHVPEGSLGASGGELHPPGWHLKAPLDEARLFPLKGRLAAIDIDRRGEDGEVFKIRLTFNYELTPRQTRGIASEIAESGLAAAVERVCGSALDPFPLAALLPPERTAGGGRSSLPKAAREEVAAALRAVGVEPLDLIARIGHEEAFTPSTPCSVASAGASMARGAMPSREETGLRLLLIGLDGADWDVLDPLLRAGRLPNLAALLENGARALLRSYDPMISPLLWNTMVTGMGPDIHGVADFQAIDPISGRRVPISSTFRRVKALWNILSDADAESAFVAWWASHPAEETRGYQVSNLVAFEALRPRAEGTPVPARLTYPPDYFEEIRTALTTVADLSYEEVRSIIRIDRREFEKARAEVLERPTVDPGEEERKLAQKPVHLVLSILTGSRNYATIAADLAARHLDLTAVYFEGIDMIGHRFQHCMPPPMAICPPEDASRFGDAVEAFCVRQDELLGEVLQSAGKETTVMVVSDHGFRSGSGRPVDVLPFTTRQPVEWHDPEGIFVLSGPAARRGERLAVRPNLFDIAPTILYLMGLPVAEDMEGRVLLPAIDPAFARRHPVRTIRSYEPLGSPREVLTTQEPEEDDAARLAQEELLASLQALGYLGGGGGGEDEPGNVEDAGADTQVFYHRNLATYFMKRGEYARAAEQLRLANERQRLPKNYEMLSEAYLAMGRRRQAIAVLKEALQSIETTDPEAVLWIVRLCLEGEGGSRAALAEAERFAARTAEKPGLDEAITGLIAESGGDRSEALASYRLALDADPMRVLVMQRLYELESPPERAARLEPALRRALAVDPRIDEYHNLLGVILAETGRAEEALEAFRMALDLDPDNPRFAVNVAGALIRLERWSEAALAYERASGLNLSPATSMKLGSVYRRLNRPERALAAFARARDLGDEGSGPILGMALARVEMGQIPEALEQVRGGLDLHPDDAALRKLQDDLLERVHAAER